ncbi:hypothetical protein B0H13DRAFT_1884648 [Mycena leptocephala]|nr:hypothetical protein B0H13DRAFT_1884648 [Mycena leptocephala]
MPLFHTAISLVLGLVSSFFFFETFHSNSARKCTDVRRHIRNYRSLRLRALFISPRPYEDPGPEVGFARRKIEAKNCQNPSKKTDSGPFTRRFHRLETSKTRGIRGSLKEGRKKAQCGGGGDRYYGAGVDWDRCNTFEVLPALNNGHKRFGGEEGSRVKEKIVAKGRDREGRIDADLKNARYGGRIDSLLLAGLQNGRILLPDRARMGHSAYRTYERDEQPSYPNHWEHATTLIQAAAKRAEIGGGNLHKEQTRKDHAISFTPRKKGTIVLQSPSLPEFQAPTSGPGMMVCKG